MNSVTITLFCPRLTDPKVAESTKLSEAHAIAVVFATRDLLDAGVWKVVAKQKVVVSPTLMSYENLRAAGFFGAKVYGSGIITKFMNAFFCLAPWHDFHDPRYLERLLISPERKPGNLMLENG
ncbi:MAG TPA: hypothetical protein VG755_03915 [Nannocystaceae bacterium]|nr:hypothetical protein [Nannocystaceae bacterium]